MQEVATSARSRPRRWFVAIFATLVLGQSFLAFMGAGDDFVLGHNGWNSSAYLQSARNTLRWGTLFPVQYYTGRTPPTVADGYTHHPLGLHLHNTAAVRVFGDAPGTIRAVPALFAVLALIALILVVRRLYDERTALFAGGIYLLLPTNSIYLNMSNHENGFILWTLVWGFAYLRFLRARLPEDEDDDGDSRRRWLPWYLLALGSFAMAATWDWPAYYCALVVAIHWLAVIVRHHREAPRRLRAMLPELMLLGGFSVLVLVLFIGHFVLVAWVAGSLSELRHVFQARQVAYPQLIANHFAVVPILMFTVPILVVAFGWFFNRLWRALRGRLERRDIIALAFGIAGILHYYLFRGTAVIHSYWGWTLVPFAAIAGARVLGWLTDASRAWVAGRWPRWRRSLGAAAVGLVTAAVGGNLVVRFVDLVPRGRAVGGSLWFVERTRPILEKYFSTREMIRFANEVKARTNRRVGVLVDPALTRERGYEPRFAITLDREVKVQSIREPPPEEQLGITEGWVYVAPRRVVYQRRLIDLAMRHPVMVYDRYVMVDLRRFETAVEVYESVPRAPSAWEWYWRGPWSEPVELVRQLQEEREIRREISERAATRAPQ